MLVAAGLVIKERLGQQQEIRELKVNAVSGVFRQAPVPGEKQGFQLKGR